MGGRGVTAERYDNLSLSEHKYEPKTRQTKKNSGKHLLNAFVYIIRLAYIID
jgi:hypothetical protein